jgi:hypothetical protein
MSKPGMTVGFLSWGAGQEDAYILVDVNEVFELIFAHSRNHATAAELFFKILSAGINERKKPLAFAFLDGIKKQFTQIEACSGQIETVAIPDGDLV